MNEILAYDFISLVSACTDGMCEKKTLKKFLYVKIL